MKDFFKKYRSNSFAGTCNQHCFFDKAENIRTGRIFYKISHGGRYNYSFLFSNILDATYSDGSVSHRNMIGDPWTLHSLRVCRCGKDTFSSDFINEGERVNSELCDFKTVTFGGKTKKEVAPAEFFCSDPIELSFEDDEYLCLEIGFSGSAIPYMQELLIPAFRYEENTWRYDKKMPCPNMIGCDRPVKARIGYLGDSITEGIGPAPNSYLHWNAQLSRLLGPDYSYWNLGIGCARINDLATDSAWLYKAKQNDFVFLCCGANDTWRNYPTEGILRDIETVIDALNKAGVKVILQTIPPLDYKAEHVERWKYMNAQIKTVLKEKAALVFDECVYMSEGDRPQYNKYGAHPNEEGSKIWARELYKAIKKEELL